MFDAFPGAQAVDFANSRIGGGVLRRGATQEEALFACAPEHVVAMAVCGELLAHEALTITGARRFSYAAGSSAALRCTGATDGSAGDAPAMAAAAHSPSPTRQVHLLGWPRQPSLQEIALKERVKEKEKRKVRE